MGLNLKNYFLTLIVFAGAYETFGQACKVDQCQSGINHVCSGENTFLRCDKRGSPIPDPTFKCPAGFVCVNSKERCAENVKPACKSLCSVCDEMTHTACLSKTAFAFCIKGQPDLSMQGKCGAREHCVSSEASTCAEDTVAASCGKDTPDVPTVAPPTSDPTGEQVREKCRTSGKIGKFTTGDCKKYFYCFIRAGEIAGNIYSCPGDSQFNCKSQQCEKDCDKSCASI